MTPSLSDPGEGRTIPAMFWDAVRRRGASAALRQKELGVWRPYSWREIGETVADVVAALIALGLAPGDVVSIVSNANREWICADFGAQTAGGVVCGLSPASPSASIEAMCALSRTRFLFVEDEERLDDLFEAIDRLPELRHVVVMKIESSRAPADPRAMSFAELERIGAASRQKRGDPMERIQAERRPGDLAVLAFTAGGARDAQGPRLLSRQRARRLRGAAPRRDAGGGRRGRAAAHGLAQRHRRASRRRLWRDRSGRRDEFCRE